MKKVVETKRLTSRGCESVSAAPETPRRDAKLAHRGERPGCSNAWVSELFCDYRSARRSKCLHRFWRVEKKVLTASGAEVTSPPSNEILSDAHLVSCCESRSGSQARRNPSRPNPLEREGRVTKATLASDENDARKNLKKRFDRLDEASRIRPLETTRVASDL